ncbi:MAG: DUF1934 domain-containing protein [Clostridium butyricum]|nr:DUF1934 domain-containing protein [Clostridium butyricum]
MKKKAIVTIKSNTSEDSDDLLEVVSVGEFNVVEDSFIVKYDETELSGMEGTKTTMIIKNDSFDLIREGTTETRMEFKKNKENVVLYKTPYGIINIKTYTKKLNINVNETGGTIEVTYMLILEEEQSVKTNLIVNIVVENN